MPRSTNDPTPGGADALAQELRSLTGKLKRRLREQSSIGDLTPSQTSALLRLEKDGPTTTSGLARAEGMRPQSMGPVITALEDMELVAGSPDPADRRQTILSLTPHCQDWLQQGRAARQDWLRRAIEARFSSEEQDRIAAAVLLLGRLVEE